MTDYLFPPPEVKSIPVEGEAAKYPVNRIFCVGRNYAAHAAEMGMEVDSEAPFYFTKSTFAVLPSGETLPYPPGTENFHYEMELVVAIGEPVFRGSRDEAERAIYAYGCGLDMTRRDLQQEAREKERPWDLGKDVEGSAVLAPLTKAVDFGTPGKQRIHLELNGEVKQDAHLSDLIHSCVDVVMDLSTFYHLQPGDVILTGTPAGVGPVVAGDKLTGGIDGLAPIALTIGQPE
ncbi:fumarylacetoacetate hydrolase family protein [Vannielia sp.]|uniref:fumarylacetoacetate hydrolase family protein n=1 Tax=Vannielia sp. TaxID=2813045 RepID=UPI0026215134|nr:fumarylacetoacetate hydrolase family protein [Vannielia sp.]MDF1872804.1 fumarylacetoacetate hydrolase family protein [Vannielia sp.]